MKSRAIIEIPAGSKEKIEIKDGKPVLDRMLPIPCPVSYGYIPSTTAPDGDAIDVFVLSSEQLDTLSDVDVNLVGLFSCTDNGVQDDKFVAVLKGEKYSELELLKNLTQIGHFLLNYKTGFVINFYKTIDSPRKSIAEHAKDIIKENWELLKRLKD